jgi:uncharacterized membrane protein
MAQSGKLKMELPLEQQTAGSPLRLRSLDLLRGAIMVLMAIDHVRVYSGIPAGGTDAGTFFTRWITHFCAPGFAFLAGTAIFLHGEKLGDMKKLSRFLVGRGFLLVILEVTIIHLFWTFNFNYDTFFLAGVIWMLGWCMVLMALLIRLKPLTVGIIGIAIIAFQQVFRFVPQLLPASFQPSFVKFWEFIYPTGVELPDGMFILYVIVPWIGVMAAGYGFGLIMNMDPERRRKLCFWIGGISILLFVAVGSLMVYFGPENKNNMPFVLRLLSQNKYPASQLFLLMTLGPIIALIPLAEKAKGWFADMLITFGRVPLFYYLLHIPLIHLSALIVNFFRDGQIHQEWYGMAPFFTTRPEEIRWGLPLLYLVFVIDVALIYLACRWYSKVKERKPGSWLRFI